MAIGQTGSGKTLGYILPAIAHIENQGVSHSGYADLPCLIHALEQPDPDEPVDSLSNDFTAHKISVGLK